MLVPTISTLALTRTDHLLERGADPLDARIEGYQFAFGAFIGLAILGVVVALALLGRPPSAEEGDGSVAEEPALTDSTIGPAESSAAGDPTSAADPVKEPTLVGS